MPLDGWSGTRALYRSRVEILPATLRDVSYIVANMCPEDWAEIECQWPVNVDRIDLARLHLGGEAWVTTLDRTPVQCFGVLLSTVSVRVVWAFGTAKRKRVIPAVTRFARSQVPRLLVEGVTRIEARAMTSHPTAGRWLRGLGASETPLPCWGRDGQDFTLFWWTREAWTAGISDAPLASQGTT